MSHFNIVMLGAPCSGKGTQAQLIAQYFAMQHVSTGELFRVQIASQSPLGKEALSYIEKGNLCPDLLTINLLYDSLSHMQSGNGLILDGVPRTIQQAEMLDGKGIDGTLPIHLVINLEVSEEHIIQRMIARSKVQKRKDDTPEIIKTRIENYFALTHPLEAYYQKKGVLQTINGEQTIEEIFSEIKSVIEKRMASNER